MPPTSANGSERQLPRVDEELVVLAVTDPAQPYGASLKWPRPPSRDGSDDEDGRGGRRPSRVAGAFVLLRNGDPVLYIERGGKGLLFLARLEGEQLAAALGAVVEAVKERRLPRLGLERIDGESIVGHELEDTPLDLDARYAVAASLSPDHIDVIRAAQDAGAARAASRS